MKTIFQLAVALILCTVYTANAQVGIGTTSPDASSVLEINSTDKGLLIPRVTTANLPVTPAKGLIVFNTTENCLQQNTGTSGSPVWECLVTESNPAVKSFYPPAYALDITATGAGTFNIYNHYSSAYGNASANGVTVYPSNELDYVVLDFDNTVFSSVTINSSGLMSYNVTALPTDNKGLITVLFVVK